MMTTPDSTARPRVLFLDNLRYVLVLIVVVFHCTGSQVDFFVDAIVKDVRPLTIATWFFFLSYAFQMPLLMFIAGYFAVPSLKSKGTAGFLRSKFFRLLVPALLVLVLLNPVHRYLFHLSRSFEAGVPPVSYFGYLPYFFSGVAWLEVKSIMLMEFSILHLWFITLLFAFFVVYALLAAMRRGEPDAMPCPVPAECSLRRILAQMGVAGALTWLGSAVVLCFIASFEWVMVGSFLLVELPSVVMYAAFFGLGIVAFRSSWFARAAALGPVWPWFAACAVAAVAIIYFDILTVEDLTLLEAYPIALAYWALKSVSALLFLGFFLSLMMRYCNRPSAIHARLAAMSYRVYLLHYVVVSCVQYAFFRMPNVSPYGVFFGTIIVSLVLTYLFAAALAVPARWYGRLTSGSPARARTPAAEIEMEVAG